MYLGWTLDATLFILVLLLVDEAMYSSKNIAKYSFSESEKVFCSGWPFGSSSGCGAQRETLRQ
jgi:hypothetical protein